VIHRDLKPENMMLCEEEGVEGRTFVIDWGLAGLSPKAKMNTEAFEGEPSEDQKSVSLTITASDECLGTPPYISPEQARCEDIDERADVWSLGAILYEILIGCPPYLGRTREEILEKIRTTPAPNVLDLEPAAPATLVSIVNAAMVRDPEHRKISAKEIDRKIKAYQFAGLLKDYVKHWARSLLCSS
jgi:serine/threonine protein kinase